MPYPESKGEGISIICIEEEFHSLSLFYNIRMRKKEETLHDRESIQGNLPQAEVLLERFRHSSISADRSSHLPKEESS